MLDKLKTALVVVVLSSLIWVFAERQTSKSHRLAVEVELVSAREDRLVQFLDEHGEPLLADRFKVKLTVEGTASRIQKLKDEQWQPKILLDVQKLGYEPEGNSSQDYTIQVVKELLDGRRLPFKGTFVPVDDDDEPSILRVRVTRLVRRDLNVKVYGKEDGVELKTERLEPSRVSAFLLEGQTAEVYGRVELAFARRMRAAKEVITAQGTVESPKGTDEFTVELKLAETTSVLPTVVIKPPRLGITGSPAILNQYRVVIESESLVDDYNPIACRGSAQAIEQYRRSEHHLTLVIRQGDQINPTARPLKYCLPEGQEDIEIVDPVRTPIRFRLEKLDL